ncbi:MAG: thiamine phosphate synthase [Gammaproteobacteria bacterium]|nr:thiamine phosphate synthase [Gammaproteobacteria bacterium]
MNTIDHSSRARLRPGIYAITPEYFSDNLDFYKKVETLLRCGISALQYRAKDLPFGKRLIAANRFQALCRESKTPFIVNDDIELALACAADGVHLGQHDPDYRSLVSSKHRSLRVGISCYNSLERARDGAAAGVDYVAFGSFFPSSTKPNAVIAKPELLSAAKREFELPIVAIGGITPQNAVALLDAGADLLAVVQGVFTSPDVAATMTEFNQLFATRQSLHDG